MLGDPDDFAQAFGEAFRAFLKRRGISESEASRRMGMARATLNTYTHGLSDGKKRRATAEILAKACVLLGFEFEYQGHTITALRKGKRKKVIEDRQLHLQFTRQFDLTDKGDEVSVGLRKPPNRIEISVSLKDVS